jgi:hypothetical protein
MPDILLCSPCASRHQVPCSASWVVLGAHRVVGPGTHQGSGPRKVHTIAAAGDEGRRSSPAGPQSRVPVHELRRGRHLREARDQAKLTGAVVAAETRRSSRSTWRRGTQTPARSQGCSGAQAGQQAARAAGVSGRASRGCGAAYKGLGKTLGVRATHREACFARTRRPRQSLGRRRAKLGDDKRTPQVSGTGAEGEAAAALGGPAGPQAGCCAKPPRSPVLIEQRSPHSRSPPSD